MKRIVKTITISLSLFLMATLAGAETLDKIVAIVNDTAITQSQLNQELNFYQQQMARANAPVPAPAALRKKVLDHLIDTQLQLQLAKKENITVDDSAVTQAINRIAEQNGLTLAQLQAKLAQQGMNYADYRKEIQKQMILSELQQREVAPRVTISDQEITDFLRKNGKRLLAAPPSNSGDAAGAAAAAAYHVRDILIAAPENASAEQTAQALQQAKDTLARLRSGANVSVTSSDLGWRKLNELPDLFVAAVKNLPVGAISEPVKAPNGYHLLQLLEVRGAAPDAAAPQQPSLQQAYATHVRHILIKTNPLTSDVDVKLRLQRLRNAILHGADFAALARENSQDPGSAAKGGDLGWVNPGMLDPTFEKAMSDLKPGQISDPVKSAFGWHIIQVLERKSIAKNQDLLRTQVRAILFQRKFNEALQNWLQQLRSQSYIKLMEN